jgi:hypothetical protein
MVLKLKAFTIHAPVLLVISVEVFFNVPCHDTVLFGMSMAARPHVNDSSRREAARGNPRMAFASL